jgi:hypothetical protein
MAHFDTHVHLHFGENFLLHLASLLLPFYFSSFLQVFSPFNWSLRSFAFSEEQGNRRHQKMPIPFGDYMVYIPLPFWGRGF